MGAAVTLLSDVLVLLCLSLQVVSYHACVCGLFHSYMSTLCLCLKPSECCGCVVVCRLFWFSLPVCLLVFLLTPKTSTLAAVLQWHCQSRSGICTCVYALAQCPHPEINNSTVHFKAQDISTYVLFRNQLASLDQLTQLLQWVQRCRTNIILQGQRSLGLMELWRSRDGSSWNMPRWKQVHIVHTLTFKSVNTKLIYKSVVLSNQRVMDLKYYFLDHVTVLSVPSVVQSSGLLCSYWGDLDKKAKGLQAALGDWNTQS